MPSASSVIELKLYDWNRFSSSKSLGSTVIDLSKVPQNSFRTEWWPVDKAGEVNISLQVVPAAIDVPAKFNVTLDSFRIILERSHYYPGEVVRGVLALLTHKPTKIHSINLIFEGYSYTCFSTGQSAADLYEAEASVFNTTAMLVGGSKSDEIVLPPGEHYYPFEYCLPTNISQSHNEDGSWLVYRFAALVDVIGKPNKTCTSPVWIRWHTSQYRPEDRLPCLQPVTKPQDVRVEMYGKAQAYSEGDYTVSIYIDNQGKKPIEKFLIDLEERYFLCARSNWGNPNRSTGDWRVRASWPFDAIPGLPIAPGSSYTGSVTVRLPLVPPSLHSTRSPIIQNAYRFNIRTINEKMSVAKNFGNTTVPVLMGARYAPGCPKPAPNKSATFVTYTAPPHCGSWTVPARFGDQYYTSGSHDFPSFNFLQGQTEPTQIEDRSKVFQSTESATIRTKPEHWSLGTVPKWMPVGEQGEEGLEPGNEQASAAYYS